MFSGLVAVLDVLISQIGFGLGSVDAFPLVESQLIGQLPGCSFPDDSGCNIPSQYARPRAQFLGVGVTSWTSASNVIAAQSRALFSHLEMTMLPRALVTAYELCCSSNHCTQKVA
jgi:hypothetical protein